MKFAIRCLLLLTYANLALAEKIPTTHAQKTLEIFSKIVEMETSKNLGNVPGMANYLRDELITAGFPASDVEVLPLGETAAFVATFRGDGSSEKAPILLLGHMDVVEALAEDWERPPFELTQDDTFFFGRGTRDNKFGIAQLTSTFIRLKKEGFAPNRDLILVFSGDEETAMVTTRMLANERPDLAKAEFALNSDAGKGILSPSGEALAYSIQAAEKTYVTWEITVNNPGGHSSRPRPDNAIYDLADAIKRIQAYQFPVRWSEMTLAFFAENGKRKGGELGDAMLRFAANPKDKSASDRLAIESSYVGFTRTTCVVTMLSAGHAENALPQSATATVNCRVYPGVPVAQVREVLAKVIGNEAVVFKQLEEAVESPESELREDVVAAVSKAVQARYPEVAILGYMGSGATDGAHFRGAGIPTLGTTGVLMNPDDNYAHGLNERVPIKAFYDALDHWSIILKELASN